MKPPNKPLIITKAKLNEPKIENNYKPTADAYNSCAEAMRLALTDKNQLPKTITFIELES